MRDWPERKSTRLQGYDYAASASYFVTIGVQGRGCLFGEVVDGVMVLNIAGLMIESWWGQIEVKFPTVSVDAYVVMPNHFHGIVMLGARVEKETSRAATAGGHTGPPLQNVAVVGEADVGAMDGSNVGADLRVRPPLTTEMPRNPTLAHVIQWFKTMTTNDYMRGVRGGDFPPFSERLWQRNYYEHIVREGTLDKVRAYIEGNPARWTEDEENPARTATR